MLQCGCCSLVLKLISSWGAVMDQDWPPMPPARPRGSRGVHRSALACLRNQHRRDRFFVQRWAPECSGAGASLPTGGPAAPMGRRGAKVGSSTAPHCDGLAAALPRRALPEAASPTPPPAGAAAAIGRRRGRSGAVGPLEVEGRGLEACTSVGGAARGWRASPPPTYVLAGGGAGGQPARPPQCAGRLLAVTSWQGGQPHHG